MRQCIFECAGMSQYRIDAYRGVADDLITLRTVGLQLRNMSSSFVEYCSAYDRKTILAGKLNSGVALIFKSYTRSGFIQDVIPRFERGKEARKLFCREIGRADINLHLRIGGPCPEADCRRILPDATGIRLFGRLRVRTPAAKVNQQREPKNWENWTRFHLENVRTISRLLSSFCSQVEVACATGGNLSCPFQTARI